MSRRIAIVGCRPPRDGMLATAEAMAAYLAIVVDVRRFIEALPRDTVIVSGGAMGVDQLARLGARMHGMKLVEHLPDWSRGKAAGMIRNGAIVRDSDEVHAWPAPWSRGTWDTVRKAREAGKVYVVHELGRNLTTRLGN